KSYGGTAGADTKISDYTSIGIAASMIRTDIKHRNDLSGNKTNIDLYVFSLYGIHDFGNNWFTNGTISFGLGDVTLRQERNISKSQARYNSKSYGAEII